MTIKFQFFPRKDTDCKYKKTAPNISEMHLPETERIIGEGHFSTIHLVYDENNKPYALKLFHTGNQVPFYEKKDRPKIISLLKSNVAEGIDTFSNPIFTSPVIIIPSSPDNPWYIMEYFDCINASKLAPKKSLRKNKDLIGKILLTYTQMLEHIHTNNRLFIDNSLESILIGKNKIKICDFDTAFPKEEIEDEDHFIRETRHISYASKEQVLEETPTEYSDLEGFALIMHHLLIGKPLVGQSPAEDIEHKIQANLNKRSYHQPSLPKEIRQVITPLLTYPRTDETHNTPITLQDIKQAIKIDFKI